MAKYVRYKQGSTVRYGVVENDLILPLGGEFPDLHPSDDAAISLADVQLLAPTSPSKIIAVGSNFRDVSEGPNSVSTDEIKFWVKPSSVLLDPEGVIEMPSYLPGVKVYHEVELAIVIGKTAKRVKAEDAHDYIFGYSCVNDVTAGNFDQTAIPESSPYFIYGKTFDGFGPYGPSIVTDIDPGNLHLECRVNGEVRQSASSAGLRFGPAQVIERITGVMTLYPGDVISMGTPPGVDTLADGDIVECEIEHVGILRNSLRSAQ